jgi:hypothetical protein
MAKPSRLPVPTCPDLSGFYRDWRELQTAFGGTTINGTTNIRNSLKNQGIKGHICFLLDKNPKTADM